VNLRFPVRYLGWLARDAAVRPGLACLTIAALFSFIATRLPVTLTESSARDFLIRTVGQFDWLLVLIATAGMVSWDRASGYYRSLFSQPINPGLYYLVRWLLAGVAVVAFLPLLGLGLLTVSGTLPYSGPLLARLLLKYLLLGGLTFALSTVLRADWLIAFLISVLQGVLHTLERSGAPLSGFTKTLTLVLPPFHASSVGFGTITYPTGQELAHVLLYGTGLMALALSVLALRPLGSGGRA
jgi:hypothetical protein